MTAVMRALTAASQPLCAVCGEVVHRASADTVVVRPCGHKVHRACLREHVLRTREPRQFVMRPALCPGELMGAEERKDEAPAAAAVDEAPCDSELDLRALRQFMRRDELALAEEEAGMGARLRSPHVAAAWLRLRLTRWPATSRQSWHERWRKKRRLDGRSLSSSAPSVWTSTWCRRAALWTATTDSALSASRSRRLALAATALPLWLSPWLPPPPPLPPPQPPRGLIAEPSLLAAR